MRHQSGCMRGILKLPAMGRFHRHRSRNYQCLVEDAKSKGARVLCGGQKAKLEACEKKGCSCKNAVQYVG